LAERALNAEMDHHLAGDGGADNRRNGYGRKTVLTGEGKIGLDVPRDRQSSFDPQLLAKYQRRFPDFNDKIISMYARGMSVREIVAHVRELYRDDELVEIDTVTMVTTTPNAVVKPIHPDRMPLILDPSDYETWMAGDPEEARRLARPWPDDRLQIVREGLDAKADPAPE
jgi:hypothetical protein